jgi:hypothetical protein
MNWFEYLEFSEEPKFNMAEYLRDHATAKKFKFPHGHSPIKSDLKDLADFLMTNNSVKVLDLSRCDIGVSGMKILAPFIEKNASLNTFQFFSNQLGDEGCDILSLALSNRFPQKPVTLGLRLNNLTEKSAFSISAILKTVPIRSLDISNNNLGDTGVVEIFENSGHTAHVEACVELNVSHCFSSSAQNVKSNALVALSKLLRTPCALKKLDMSGNELKDDDFYSICSAIMDNSSRNTPSKLTELRLNENNLTGKIFQALAELLLNSHHSIKKIDMMLNNKIHSDNGLYSLKEALKKNHIICELDLTGTRLCERGKGVLLDAILDNIEQYKAMLDDNPKKYNLRLRIDKFNDWLGNVPWTLETINEVQSKIDSLQEFCKASSFTFKHPYVEIEIMEAAVAEEKVQGTSISLLILTQFSKSSNQKLSTTDLVECIVDESCDRPKKRARTSEPSAIAPDTNAHVGLLDGELDVALSKKIMQSPKIVERTYPRGN